MPVACPSCKKQLAYGATVCQGCGREFTRTEITSIRSEGRKGCLQALGVLVVLTAVLSLLAWGCEVITADSEPEQSADRSRTITAADVAGEWPFTVDSGVIECRWLNRSTVELPLFTAEGRTYGLNGVARSEGYPDVDPIWKPLIVDGQNMTPAKVSISEVADLARSLC